MPPPTITREQVRLLRLRAHGLLDGPTASVRAAVARPPGIQAQEIDGAAVGVRARARGISASDVDGALREGTVIRTWCMRGTLHLVARDDLPWLLSLLGPEAIRRSRRRREQLELSDEVLDRSRDVLLEMLATEAPATRDEIGTRLAHAGRRLEGQALYHFLRHMALEGWIRFGPRRGGDDTFVLLDQELRPSPGLARDDAMARLARRYLAGHGPATADDLARWAGVGRRQARAGMDAIRTETVEVRPEQEPCRILAAHESWLDEGRAANPNPSVRLVPGYDPYLLGYRSRDFAVPPEYAPSLHPGGGFMRPAVLVEGRAVGSWKKELRGDTVNIRVQPFGPLEGPVLAGLEDEARDLARFHGVSAVVEVASPTTGSA